MGKKGIYLPLAQLVETEQKKVQYCIIPFGERTMELHNDIQKQLSVTTCIMSQTQLCLQTR